MGRLMTALGFPPMPWQQHVLDVALELLDDGSWAYPIVVETVPRQSGKTAKAVGVHTHRGLIRPDARSWFTAQRRQDARDTWLDAVKVLRRSPLGPRLAIRESNGSECVTFPTGSTFRPFAPGEDALHGKANELVEVDEAWAFTDSQGADLEQAILPTFTTTGGQMWLKSTAGTARSGWLRSYRDRGRAHVDADRRGPVAYFEWSLADDDVAAVVAGIDPDATEDARRAALELLLAAHPAAHTGGTLRLPALEQALEVMEPGQFLRAYGNRWTRAAEQIIPAGAWADCRGDLERPAAVALAYAVALDRRDACVAAAWRDVENGPVRVDVIDHRPGTSWLVERVVDLAARWELVAPVGHDGIGPAGDIADELRRRGVKLAPTSTADYAAACAGILSDVTDGHLTHPGAASLDAAVAAAGKRPIGDRWAFGRQQSDGSISPLEAVTVARWTFDHRPARRKPRIRSAA